MSKLVRNTSNKMVGGVCAGIADAYGYDVTLVRIITAALVLFAGAGPILYLIAWMIMPSDENMSPRNQWNNQQWNNGAANPNVFDPYQDRR
ncbi:MAG: PspC domain-containing protein [Propionibacterium sp.]|jgi:pspC domain protein|nr:PspC domain-containing protein [Propionibacterium sp.]